MAAATCRWSCVHTALYGAVGLSICAVLWTGRWPWRAGILDICFFPFLNLLELRLLFFSDVKMENRVLDTTL